MNDSGDQETALYSYLRGMGMLVVSFRGKKYILWSHLGCSGRNTNILVVKVFSRVSLEVIYPVTQIWWSKSIRKEIFNVLTTISEKSYLKCYLLGVELCSRYPDWSPLGVCFDQCTR